MPKERHAAAHQAHGAAYYRCRYAQEYAPGRPGRASAQRGHARDALVTPLDRWLARELAADRRDHTISMLAQQAAVGLPDPAAHAIGADLVARHDELIAEYDEKIARYRAALDAGADPSLVAGWITEAQKQRDRAAARRSEPPGQDQATAAPTADEIAAVLHRLGDLTTALAEADPEHKMEVYRALGLKLTYEPETQTVHASVDLGVHRWDPTQIQRSTRPSPPPVRLAGTIALL